MATVRSLRAAIAASAALAALAACTDASPAPAPDPTPTAEPSTSAPEESVLRFAVHGNEHVVAAYREIADAFSAERPEVTVEIEEQPDARSGAATVRSALEAGDGPDVFLLHESWLPQFVQDGLLRPLDIALEQRGLQFGDDYQRVALTTFSANSGLQCMPAEMSPLVVFHNRKLLPRLQLLAQGVTLPATPETDEWSWEDFTATARAAAAGAPGSPRSPIHGAYVPPDVELLTALLRSAGTDVVDDVFDPTSLTLASDEAIETLQRVAGLSQDFAVSPTPQEIVETDPLTTFLEGRLAMYVGTRADVPAMRATEGLRFDVFPLPDMDRARSVAETTGLCVDAASDQSELAADFIAFAVGEEGAAIAARSGALVPSHLDTLVTEDFQQPGRAPRNEYVFAESLRRSDLLPSSPAWPEVADRVEALLTRIYLDPGFDLEERLVRALERINARSQGWFDPTLETEVPEEISPAPEPTD